MRSVSSPRLFPPPSLASTLRSGGPALLLLTAFLVPGCGGDAVPSPASAVDVPTSPPDTGAPAPDVTAMTDVVAATVDAPAIEVGGGSDAGPSTLPAAGPQTPPSSGRVDLEAWIAAGHYRAWHCEPEPHASRAPSPHGLDRICSNDALSGSSGSGPYPVGAAAVKELYGGAPGTVTGYAVYLKVAEGSGGASWYWYERIGTRGVADGLGTSGSARTICVGCHASAPRDFVFTHVR